MSALLPCHVSDPDLWFAEAPSIWNSRSRCAGSTDSASCLRAALERAEPWVFGAAKSSDRGPSSNASGLRDVRARTGLAALVALRVCVQIASFHRIRDLGAVSAPGQQFKAGSAKPEHKFGCQRPHGTCASNCADRDRGER